MKFSYRLNIIALGVIVLTFAACKKSATPAATKTNTIDYKTLASQIGTSLYRSMNGSLNIDKSVTANALHGKSASSYFADISSLCGYTLDSFYTIDSVSAFGNKFSSYNSFALTNTCATDIVNGYTVADTITYISTYVNNQIDHNYFGGHDTVTALDATFKLYNLNGIAYSNTYSSTNGPVVIPVTQSLTSISKDIKIDVSSGQPNFISGSAIFSGLQHTGDLSATFSGKVNYIGNFEAQIVFDQPNSVIYTYTINILTGDIVSIP